MTRETVWTYSDKEKALGHKMRAITGRTDECEYCGAMVNDCQNWPGRTGGTVWEPCKLAPKTTETPNAALRGAEPASSAERPLEGTVMRKEEEC